MPQHWNEPDVLPDQQGTAVSNVPGEVRVMDEDTDDGLGMNHSREIRCTQRSHDYENREKHGQQF
jgi:hypothetical protein